MALYEFHCDACGKDYEQITSSTDPDQGRCPKCNEKKSRRRISLFAVAGRGDLRETTMHGCHDCSVTPGQPDSDHSGHDHGGHDHTGHDHGDSGSESGSL